MNWGTTLNEWTRAQGTSDGPEEYVAFKSTAQCRENQALHGVAMMLKWGLREQTSWYHRLHGSLNVPIEHHPTIRYMVYNGYYKVMFNIPKMGQLPTPGLKFGFLDSANMIISLTITMYHWVWNSWGYQRSPFKSC